MSKKSLKNIIFKRLLRGNSKNDVKCKDAIFLVLCTLVEIGFPIYFLLSENKLMFLYKVLIVVGTVIVLFLMFIDLDEFFQSNYIDLLFFKYSTYIVLMLFSWVLFWVNRERFVEVAELGGDPFTTLMITVVFYSIFLIGTFFCVFLTDIVAVLIVRILAYFLKVDMNNQYMEKLKFSKTVEGSEEYTKRRIKSEYENRFQESSIDEASFEHYCFEQHKNQQYITEIDLDEQSYLFEHTKHFKMICSLDQVDSRYEMLMKIYMPQNGSD